MIANAGPLLIVNAYPDLTLPQGDDGNVLVLAHRARARGIEVETRTVHCGEDLPPADIYVVGGLEDEDQAELARWLDSSGALRRAVEAGAAVLGIDSGYQVLGERFALPDGTARDGLGLLAARTRKGEWVEGPVVTRPNVELSLPVLSGYESHCGRTVLGAGAVPLAFVEVGEGNGSAPGDGASGAKVAVAPPRTDGAVAGGVFGTGGGRVFGTYLHGPVLARNPELADLLLSAVTGRELEPLPSPLADSARRRRLEEARAWAAKGRPKVKM